MKINLELQTSMEYINKHSKDIFKDIKQIGLYRVIVGESFNTKEELSSFYGLEDAEALISYTHGSSELKNLKYKLEEKELQVDVEVYDEALSHHKYRCFVIRLVIYDPKKFRV